MDSYPPTEIGKRMRQFCKSWFEGPYSKWLEYSVEKDYVYCLCCYLFKDDFFHESTSEFYTKTGFRSWNRALERFRKHVGDVNNIHDKCFNKMLDLSNHHQSIQVVLDKHSQKLKNEYQMRLEASIDVSRLLLQYGLPFRGHDESDSSTNQGFFLGCLRWHGDKHRDVGKVILENDPQNDTLTCPMIQKDIDNACAKETLKAIIEDLNGDYFGILVDESKYISHKEQMALVLRSVNKNGEVVERFIYLVHVSDTSSCSLKKAIYSLLSVHSLSPSKIHGQDQDIVNAMEFLNITKKRLQDMRENGWESLLDDVSSFCDVHDILIPKLDESYFPEKRKSSGVSYAQHLRVEVFVVVIDMQLQELNNRFDVSE
ncbi:zinc finger MYM-type protein 1-like [Solanum tuberosum]|uniref:zinc finger MYM-type protein 1-like n=1 Tax=Solanum tuberosum TaxID=4113 RepID=UPI00073A4A9F|nr:PREDICTED: zinc finger MYM-type protein 1-like [Solanum tuberosum]